MANIRERADTPLDLRPTEVGVEATAAAARRGGAFFNQAAGAFDALGQRAGSAIRDAGEVAVKYEDHQQISAGAANGAQLIENLNKSWEQTAKEADPNDPSHAAKWREETLGPALEQFQSGFTTEKSQQWAEHFVDQARTHMFQKTAADMSGLAADAVHINTLKTINSLGNTLSSDPSGLEFARNALKSSLDGLVDSSPNLTAAQAAKVRNDLMFKGEEHLVKSAVTGAILKGGDWQSLANDPKNSPFINANEMLQFEKAAKAQQKSEMLTQKALEEYAHKQLVRTAEAGFGKAWNENVSFDADGKVTIKPELFQQVLDANRKTEGAAYKEGMAIVNWGQAQQRDRREVIVTDKGIYNDLITRMVDPNNPTTKAEILNAATRDKIDTHHTSLALQLREETQHAMLKEPAFQEKLKAIQGMLGVGVIPDGHDRYSQALQELLKVYPKLPENERWGALDTKNPNSLISKIIGAEAGTGLRPTTQQLQYGHLLKRFGGSLGGFETPANMTGPGKGVISTTVQDIPPGMSPADAIKKFSGQKVRLPDGRVMTAP